MTRQQQLELHPLHVTSVSAAVRWALEMPQSLHRGTEGARTKTRLPWMRVTHVFTEFQQKRPPLLHPHNPNSNIFLLLVLLYPHHAGSRTGSSGPDCRLQLGHVFRFGSLDAGRRDSCSSTEEDGQEDRDHKHKVSPVSCVWFRRRIPRSSAPCCRPELRGRRPCYSRTGQQRPEMELRKGSLAPLQRVLEPTAPPGDQQERRPDLI
ncbi:hypothetical protein E3U43_021487 [Larimichthys crocea]|uniref:Uncharacterized protein n=1 Tax=Larimichthys crocea TaxID=215358 RepID=A0ACD3R6M6_LARCR|nr:hypothetical protein E3U43_021487 [Larimichthys crocea]